MLENQISGFIAYCKVSGFKSKSLESLSLRLNQFKHFLDQSRIPDIGSIRYRHLRRFVADYRLPSIHVKKARIWALRQFYHYLTLNGLVEKNIATDLAYPKIEKTVPHFLTTSEYERILEHCVSAVDSELGLRNLIIVAAGRDIHEPAHKKRRAEINLSTASSATGIAFILTVKNEKAKTKGEVRPYDKEVFIDELFYYCNFSLDTILEADHHVSLCDLSPIGFSNCA